MHIGQYKPIKDPMITIKQQLETVTSTIIMNDPAREKYHIACTNDESPSTSRKKRNYIPNLCSCNGSKELNPQHSNSYLYLNSYNKSTKSTKTFEWGNTINILCLS